MFLVVEYTYFTYLLIEPIPYSDYLKGGELWISLTDMLLLNPEMFGLKSHQKLSRRLKS